MSYRDDDGSGRRSNPYSDACEEDVCRLVDKLWHWKMGSFGPWSPIDRYAHRDDKLIALVEIKARNNSWSKYPTVLFNLRKFMWLREYGLIWRVPSFFFARFDDAYRYISIADIDTHVIEMAGERHGPSPTDWEPCIHVAINAMREATWPG